MALGASRPAVTASLLDALTIVIARRTAHLNKRQNSIACGRLRASDSDRVEGAYYTDTNMSGIVDLTDSPVAKKQKTEDSEDMIELQTLRAEFKLLKNEEDEELKPLMEELKSIEKVEHKKRDDAVKELQTLNDKQIADLRKKHAEEMEALKKEHSNALISVVAPIQAKMRDICNKRREKIGELVMQIDNKVEENGLSNCARCEKEVHEDELQEQDDYDSEHHGDYLWSDCIEYHTCQKCDKESKQSTWTECKACSEDACCVIPRNSIKGLCECHGGDGWAGQSSYTTDKLKLCDSCFDEVEGKDIKYMTCGVYTCGDCRYGHREGCRGCTVEDDFSYSRGG